MSILLPLKNIIVRLLVLMCVFLVTNCNSSPQGNPSATSPTTRPLLQGLPKFTGFSSQAPPLDFQGVRIEFEVPQETVDSFYERQKILSTKTVKESIFPLDKEIAPFSINQINGITEGYPDEIRVFCNHTNGTKYPTDKPYYPLPLETAYIHQDIRDLPVGTIHCSGHLFGEFTNMQAGIITQSSGSATIHQNEAALLYMDFSYHEPGRTGSLQIRGSVSHKNAPNAIDPRFQVLFPFPNVNYDPSTDRIIFYGQGTPGYKVTAAIEEKDKLTKVSEGMIREDGTWYIFIDNIRQVLVGKKLVYKVVSHPASADWYETSLADNNTRSIIIEPVSIIGAEVNNRIIWNVGVVTGFVLGSGDTTAQLIGSIGSDFLIVGDVRDIATNSYFYLFDKSQFDGVTLGLAAAGVVPTPIIDQFANAFKKIHKKVKQLRLINPMLANYVSRRLDTILKNNTTIEKELNDLLDIISKPDKINSIRKKIVLDEARNLLPHLPDGTDLKKQFEKLIHKVETGGAGARGAPFHLERILNYGTDNIKGIEFPDRVDDKLSRYDIFLKNGDIVECKSWTEFDNPYHYLWGKDENKKMAIAKLREQIEKYTNNAKQTGNKVILEFDDFIPGNVEDFLQSRFPHVLEIKAIKYL